MKTLADLEAFNAGFDEKFNNVTLGELSDNINQRYEKFMRQNESGIGNVIGRVIGDAFNSTGSMARGFGADLKGYSVNPSMYQSLLQKAVDTLGLGQNAKTAAGLISSSPIGKMVDVISPTARRETADYIGNELLSSADTWDKIYENQWAPKYSRREQYHGRTLPDLLTDTEYLTDSRGLIGDVLGGTASSYTSLVGMLPAAAVGGLPGIIGSALLGGGLETVQNSSEVYKNKKKQGYSDEDAINAMHNERYAELPMNLALAGLSSGLLTGQVGKALAGGKDASLKRKVLATLGVAPFDMGLEGVQEVAQSRLTDAYSYDKPINTDLRFTPNEWDEFNGGVLGALLPNAGGAVTTVADHYFSQNNSKVPTKNDTDILSAGNFDTNLFEKWESAPGATDLDNVRPEIKGALNNIASELGNGGKIIITGGAEKTYIDENGQEKHYHAEGEFGHEGGWKVDIDKNSITDPQKFFALCEKYGIAVGDEGDHYDLSAHKNGNTGGKRVATPSTFLSDMLNGGQSASPNNAMTKEEQIAAAISKNTGIPADWIWAQMYHETGGFSSDLAKLHNYGGVKGAGNRQTDNLGHSYFDSDEDYINYMSNYYKKYAEDGLLDAKTPEEFVHALKKGGYFTDDESNYLNGVKSALARRNGVSISDTNTNTNANNNIDTSFIDEETAQDNTALINQLNAIMSEDDIGLSREQRLALLNMATEQKQIPLANATTEEEEAYYRAIDDAIRNRDLRTIAQMFPQQAAEILGISGEPTILEMREAIKAYLSNEMDNNRLSVTEWGDIQKVLNDGDEGQIKGLYNKYKLSTPRVKQVKPQTTQTQQGGVLAGLAANPQTQQGQGQPTNNNGITHEQYRIRSFFNNNPNQNPNNLDAFSINPTQATQILQLLDNGDINGASKLFEQFATPVNNQTQTGGILSGLQAQPAQNVIETPENDVIEDIPAEPRDGLLSGLNQTEIPKVTNEGVSAKPVENATPAEQLGGMLAELTAAQKVAQANAAIADFKAREEALQQGQPAPTVRKYHFDGTNRPALEQAGTPMEELPSGTNQSQLPQETTPIIPQAQPKTQQGRRTLRPMRDMYDNRASVFKNFRDASEALIAGYQAGYIGRDEAEEMLRQGHKEFSANLTTKKNASAFNKLLNATIAKLNNTKPIQPQAEGIAQETQTQATDENAVNRTNDIREYYNDRKEEYRTHDLEELVARRKRYIRERIDYYNANPGGQGQNTVLYDENGMPLNDPNAKNNAVRRETVSNNPEWYQRAYALLGRKPAKKDYEYIADVDLSEWQPDEVQADWKALNEVIEEKENEEKLKAEPKNVQKFKKDINQKVRDYKKGIKSVKDKEASRDKYLNAVKGLHDKAIRAATKDETKAAMEEAYNNAVIEVNRAYDEATAKNAEDTAQAKSIQNNDVASEATNKEAQTKKAATEGVQENEIEASNTESNETEKGGVVVTGDEFGEYKDIMDLRKKAVNYYAKELQGTSVENKTLGKIDIDENGLVNFTGSGKREFKNSSAKKHKLLLVKYLKDLISNATNIEGKPSSKTKHDREYFYYLHTEAEIEGKNTPVEITLVKRNDGSIQYYNHTLPSEENKNDAVVSTEPVSSNEALGTPSIPASSVDSTIPQTEPTSKDKNSTKQDTAQQERSQNEDAFSNANENITASYSDKSGDYRGTLKNGIITVWDKSGKKAEGFTISIDELNSIMYGDDNLYDERKPFKTFDGKRVSGGGGNLNNIYRKIALAKVHEAYEKWIESSKTEELKEKRRQYYEEAGGKYSIGVGNFADSAARVMRHLYEQTQGARLERESNTQTNNNRSDVDAFSNKQEAKAQATSTQETPDWGSEEEATAEFEKAFGVKRKSKNNNAPDKIESVNNAYFDSIAKDDDNFDDLVKELKSELSKISANPVFNPKVYELGLRIGNVLIRRGMRSFSAWSKAMVDTIGDTIKPWLNSIWRGITSLPKNKTFDERKIRAATQLVGTEYSKVNTSLEQITNSIRDKFGDEIYNSNKEYIESAYNAVAGFYNSEADQKEVTNNEPNDRADTVAKRDGRRDNQNSVGESVQGERAGDNGGRSLQENREENEPRNSARVRTDSPAVSGKISDSRVQEEKSEDRADSPRSADLSGSIKDSYNGTTALDDGRKGKDIGTSENGRNNATAKVKVVKENNIPYKAGDLKSIQADLPSLMPEQMEDVVKAEKRLLLDHGKGMMFTNGTGTGKTFTGLGVVKRFVLAGKQNIIIVAPNDDILNEWVRSGKKYFDLDIHKLENTRTAGSGIIATTYANFGQNNTLVKREWDLVVTDESHKLMSSEKADDTAALNTMRALTRHVQGVERRLEMLFPKIAQRIQDILKKLRSNDISEQEENKLNDEVWELRKKLDPERKKLYDETNALKDEDKPKVLFLSATPFAYVKAVDYANGYLFDYEKADNSGYNSGDGYDRFFMEHFGYRMRYNKLTRPDASVNQDLMEREFNSWLKKTGALSGRTLKLDTDYDRGFLLVDGGVGAKIDAGMKIFEDDLRNEKSKYALLGTIVEGRLKGRFTRYILEAIKAKESVKLVQQYLDAGKKVVLFHDFNKNEARNPFELTMEDFNTLNMVDDTGNSARMALKEYELFQREHPELLNLDLSDLASPIEVIQKAFGDRARIFNGKVSKKDRTKAVKDFNDDDSGADVILCQRDAGKEGISLHDTTGKHQRVLIDLGLATKPTDTIQTEGRIRRTGAVSNAIIRYLNTGTNVERFAFATTIAGRASTAENLAMGEEARNLKQSIIDSFEESQNDDWQKYLPGSETEGTGGQAKDASDASKVSLYEKAKTFYYGRGKRTSKNKAREGKDYFATPEPIGLKMVEWLRLENGESALEPSAGHGAISRWFSETTKNTIIEPSGELSTQARMTLNGGTTSRVVSGTFENFDLVNKFDGIAMNPPFGTGGKTAVDHIAKAFKHLRVGGRMVAILPEGASADKHFNKWYYGEEKDGEQVGGVENAHLVANIHLPTVTFERVGTKVATRIVVIDKLPKNYEGYLNSTEELDLRGITDINELFDELENMEMPRRKITARSQEMRNNDNAPTTSLHFTPGTFTRTDNGKVIPNAKINARVARDVYEKINNIAKKHGGRYETRYSKSFLFERGGEEGRDAFIKEAEEVLNKISAESPIENSDNVGDNKGKRRYSLSMSDKNLTKTNDDWTTNHIHIGENGNRTIELLYRPFANEEVEERYRRRMMEVARIDPKYDKGVSKNPYVNFIGKSGRDAIEARFNRGQSLDEIVDDLNYNFKNIIYNEGIQNEGRVIERLMALRGGIEYAREYARNNNARGDKRTSLHAIQRGHLEHTPSSEQNGGRISREQNRIRPTSRTEEGGFYNAQRSVEELKAEAKEAFPNATEIKETADGVILTMPNGMKMTVNIKGEITASEEELADAREAHNIASDIEVTIEGYEETVDGGAFIALSQGSRKGTGFHEAYHVAEELVFTDKEKKDAKRLISPNDEKRADEFAKWKLDRKKGGNFAKLWRKIADFAARMASLAGYETKRGLFLKVESGEMYNRKGNVERNSGRKYNSNVLVPSAEEINEVRKKYEGTEEWLKAPNGEDTNLTEEQWLTVRTPSFKKWFGDWENDPKNASKVVDENGEPRVVYHGSKAAGFFEFQGNYGNIFFVYDKEVADWYAGNTELVNADTKTDGLGIGKRHINDVIKFLNDKTNLNYHLATDKDIVDNVYKTLKQYGVKQAWQDKSELEEIKEIIDTSKKENFDKNKQELIILAKKNLPFLRKLVAGKGSINDVQKVLSYQNEAEKIIYTAESLDITRFSQQLGLRFIDEKFVNSSKLYANKFGALKNEEEIRREATNIMYQYASSGVYAAFVNARNPLVVNANSMHWESVPFEPFKELKGVGQGTTDEIGIYAKERGYDGVIIQNVFDTDITKRRIADEVIVYNSNQIKSATDNIGTFDANNPDIRYSLAPIGQSTDTKASPNSNEGVWQKIKNIFTSDKGKHEQYRRQMKETLENALGVKIRYGKMDESKGAVIYKEKDKVIRSKHAYDWENILPVAGEIVARQLGIVKKNETVTEAQRNVFANWMLEGKLDDSPEAKAFETAMKNPLNAAVKTRLENARTNFQTWQDKEADERMQECIQDQKEKGKSLKEWREHIYNEVVEEFAPIQRLVDAYEEQTGKKLGVSINPMVAFRLLRGQGERVLAMVNGETELAVKALQTRYPSVDWTNFKTIKDIIGSIGAYQNKEKQNDFATYCVACHMLDLHDFNENLEVEKRMAKEDVEALQRQIDETQDANYKEALQAELKDAEDNLKRIEAQKPYTIHDDFSREKCEKYIEKRKKEYGKAQRDLVNYSNVLMQILYDSGYISGKHYKSMVNKWKNYVPMYRVFEENEEIDFGDSLMKFEGSKRDIVNPIESIIHNTGEYIKKAERNKAISVLANFARCDGSGWLAEEVDNRDPNTRTQVTFRENGKVKYIELGDPTIAKAINKMDLDSSNLILKLCHAVTAIARASFTTANPEFIIRNPLRDSADAFLYDGVYPWDIVKGFMHAFRKDATYYDWMTSGAAQSSLVSLDRDYTQEIKESMGENWKNRLLSKKFLPTVIQGLQKMSEFSEYATRIAVYKNRKAEYEQAGMDARDAVLSAALRSRDLIDFGRHGKTGANYNKLVPFANASIQGLDKFYRELIDPKGWKEDTKGRAKTLMRLGLTAILPAMLVSLLWGDDDWYKKRCPNWVKDTHWVLPLGKDSVIRIPKGADVGIRFFSNAFQKMMDDNPHKFKEYFAPIVEAMPGIGIAILKPAVEVMFNKNSFTGADIVPKYQEENFSAKMQYGAYTTGFSKWLGEKLDFAPRKIDHLIAGYAGTPGMFIPKAVDVLMGNKQLSTSKEDLPISRALLYPKYKNSQIVQDFYDELKRQKEFEKEYKDTKKRPEEFGPQKLKRMKDANNKLKKLNEKENAAIEDPKLSYDRRKEIIASIYDQRNKLVERALRK